jgi:hypothetical protein
MRYHPGVLAEAERVAAAILRTMSHGAKIPVTNFPTFARENLVSTLTTIYQFVYQFDSKKTDFVQPVKNNSGSEKPQKA